MFTKQSFIVYIFISIAPFYLSAQENTATRLGYPPDAKLLIIHADDLGVSHSENIASIDAIEYGSVNSGSVMMPTPWVLEIIDYALSQPNSHDLGLHLVLTAEWKHYKWSPVASKNHVSSLVNEYGHFHDLCTTELDIKEVEKEIMAQIDLAFTMGLEPTHLDTHMGCLIQSKELMEVYLKVGQMYNLPVLAHHSMPADLLKKYEVKVVMDHIYTLQPEDFKSGAEEFYYNLLTALEPGLSTILIHTAYDNEEMKGMNIDHPDWGNEWRQADTDFFTSDKCRELLKKENIQLVTWRQLRDVFYKK